MKRALLPLLLAALAGACDGSSPSMDDLRLDEVQVIGTHNSYHVAPDIDPPIPASMDYTQPPIAEQLERYGVRQLELDVWELEDGVFNCFHGWLVDEGTRCRDIRDCLGAAKSWSDAHPRHVPLVFVIEVKQVFELDNPDNVQGVLDSGFFGDLEGLLLEVFGRDRILEPDDVRGDHATLREALATDGWPRLGDVRGKSMFVLNTTSERIGIMDAYVQAHPGMRGAVLFAKKGEDADWGAILELNNVVRDQDALAAGLAAHYLVRTASDSIDWDDAKIAELSAVTPASGAHWVNTDFLTTQPNHGTYAFPWPSPHPVRCNPVTAPAWCDDAGIEE
jgi:hypothetical protein